MKVYALIGLHDCDRDTLVAIYSSKELAETAYHNHPDKGMTGIFERGYEILEFELI